MKLGIAGANAVPFADPFAARDLIVAAEETGVESLWTVEHVAWPTSYGSTYPYHASGKMPGDPSIPIPDPIAWLSWAAGFTARVRLGTGVLILPQRNPLVVAKQLATLDVLSGGRLELGIGVGWLKEEFDAVGVDFATRGRRTDEMLEAITRLWNEPSVAFEGEEVAFDEVASNPKPIQSPIPITIGGKATVAGRRAARFGSGFFVGPESMDELLGRIAMVHEACEDIGRDPNTMEITAIFPGRYTDDPRAAVEVMAAAGVDRILVPAHHIARTGLEALPDLLP